jgi:hypothetical protein
MMTLMQGMIQQMNAQQQNREVQEQQITLLRDGLIAAQQATATAIEKTTAPREQKVGGVSDFRRLLPKEFAGTGTALEAEQWIIDVTNLLSAARVPDAEKVDVVRIQLTDVALSWWLTEEARLDKPISWKTFTDGFYARFFPETAKREMQSQFMNLKQRDKSVEAYAAEFLRLSRFAPKLVEDEADRADRFQQGLQWDIQVQIASQSLVTYEQVLTAARRVEHVLERMNRSKGQNKNGKKQLPQGNDGSAGAKRQKNGTPTNNQNHNQNQNPQRQMYCGFCKKPGHLRSDCRREQGLCLLCGSPDHRMTECPRFKQQELVPTLPAPPVQRNPGPVGRGAPLPPQNQAFVQHQRGAGNGRGRGQINQMTAETVGMPDHLAEGNDSAHSDIVVRGTILGIKGTGLRGNARSLCRR